MERTVKIIGKKNCLLGEGPYWDAFAERMRQFDINSAEIIDIDLENGNTMLKPLPQRGTCMAQCEDGSFIFGMEDGVYREDGSLVCLKEPETGARFNDGKAGPDGLFYLGTMEKGGGAVLYRLEKGKLSRVIEHVAISNGLDFTDDGKTVYYCDTPTRRIDAFDFPSFTGRRTVFAFPEDFVGNPDGLCLDEKGRIWAATWGGHRVVCIDPEKGAIVDELPLPATYTSCPAFVGKDLSLMAVTSAVHDKDIEAAPAEGCTFLADVGVRGRKPYLLDSKKVF